MRYVTINKDDMKNTNKKSVLKYIWDHQSVTKSEISEKLDLNHVTITQLVNELETEKIVAFSDQRNSTGGRKATSIKICTENCFIASFAVVDHTLECALINLMGDILYYEKVPIENDFIEMIENKYKRYTELLNAKDKKIIGVGVSGSSNPENYDDLISKYEASIALGSVSTSYLMAEKYFGGSHLAQNMALMHIGDDVKMSIMIHENHYKGYNFEAGNLNHFKVCNEGPKCYCGKTGCFSSVVTNEGIIARYLINAKLPSHTIIDVEEITALASQGDEIALKVIKDTGYYIGRAISQIINVINPQKLFISGVYSANSIMNIEINKGLTRYCYHGNLKSVYVGEPKVKKYRNVLGAGALFLNKFLSY